MLLQSHHGILRIGVLISAIAGLVGTLNACGPDFPNSYLSNSIEELTSLPTLNFEGELARLLKAPRPKRAKDYPARCATAELEEVRAVLAAKGLTAPEVVARIAKYSRAEPPAELPEEFHLYAKGASAWRSGRSAEALSAWRRLLELPVEERRYRTVWASYMIGRVLVGSDDKAAREALGWARTFAEQGFFDSQDLALASLGWEAQTYLRQGAYGQALRLYLRQFALGDDTATVSLQLTLGRVFRGDQLEDLQTASPRTESEGACDATPAPDWVLSELAADSELRGVVTAWFTARGGPCVRWSAAAAEQFRRWIRSLRDVRNLTPDEADRWSWAAYQNGLWDDARRLSDLAPAESPASEWVRAMLLLKAGFVEEASRHLSTAARSFAKDRAMAEVRNVPTWSGNGETRSEQQPLQGAPSEHLNGVRGALALSREQYIEALRLFLSSDHWVDAAYIAEYVLTIEELRSFVTSEYAASLPSGGVKDVRAGHPDSWSETWPAHDLRFLLARRLVRAGRFDEAGEFFPPGMVQIYDSYLKNVRSGYDATLSLRARGEAFWSAAKIVHKLGMELQGTELEPDFHVWNGEYQGPMLWSKRAEGGIGPSRARWGRSASIECWVEGGLFAPSWNELERAANVRVPGQRFHYRARAVELAWLAAALLPNEDPQTALVLHTAGLWIAARDPQQAQYFYKTLVLRCPNTELGKAAAARHWFVRPAGSDAEK